MSRLDLGSLMEQIAKWIKDRVGIGLGSLKDQICWINVQLTQVDAKRSASQIDGALVDVGQ